MDKGIFLLYNNTKIKPLGQCMPFLNCQFPGVSDISDRIYLCPLSILNVRASQICGALFFY